MSGQKKLDKNLCLKSICSASAILLSVMFAQSAMAACSKEQVLQCASPLQCGRYLPSDKPGYEQCFNFCESQCSSQSEIVGTEWRLTNVSFADGGTAQGYFLTNAQGMVFQYEITTTPGTSTTTSDSYRNSGVVYESSTGFTSYAGPFATLTTTPVQAFAGMPGVYGVAFMYPSRTMLFFTSPFNLAAQVPNTVTGTVAPICTSSAACTFPYTTIQQAGEPDPDSCEESNPPPGTCTTGTVVLSRQLLSYEVFFPSQFTEQLSTNQTQVAVAATGRTVVSGTLVGQPCPRLSPIPAVCPTPPVP